MGCDIPASIRRLGPHIQYVHFRDVRGTPEDFVETFHDNGPTDMAAAMRAYRDVGFTGPMRPDHVPQLYGEDDGERTQVPPEALAPARPARASREIPVPGGAENI